MLEVHEEVPVKLAGEMEIDTSGLDWAGEYSEPTEEDIVQRARDVVPLLIPLQEETERRNHYSESVHKLFKSAGFYRTLVPKKYGGLEYSLATFLRIVVELCSGCSNTGWQFALGSSHALQLGTHMPEEVQVDMFADPNFIVPGTVVPSGEGQILENGDMRLSGIFRYCSGVPYGSHYFGHAKLKEGGVVSFLAPRETYRILNDWGKTLGMKGSGSHSVEFVNATIPAKYVDRVPGFSDPMTSQDTEGWRQHGNKMYAGSSIAVALLTITPLGVGIAKNARLAFDELMSKNTTFAPVGPRTHDPFYQNWYGEGVGKLDSAETLMIAIAEQWLQNCNEGKFSPEDDMRLIGMSREVVKLAWTAASETFFRTAGSSEIMDGKRMERAWRDMSTFYSHNGVVFFPELAKNMYAMAHFGVQPPAPH